MGRRSHDWAAQVTFFPYTLDHGNPLGDHAQEVRGKRRVLFSPTATADDGQNSLAMIDLLFLIKGLMVGAVHRNRGNNPSSANNVRSASPCVPVRRSPKLYA
jgi:hypothetical protein